MPISKFLQFTIYTFLKQLFCKKHNSVIIYLKLSIPIILVIKLSLIDTAWNAIKRTQSTRDKSVLLNF